MKKKQLTYLALAGAMALMACGSLLCGNSIVSYENVVGKTQTYSTTDHCTYINSPIVEAPVRHNALVTYSVTQVNDNTTDVKIWYNPNDRGPLITYHLEKYQSFNYIAVDSPDDESNLCFPKTTYYIEAECPVCGASTGQRFLFTNPLIPKTIALYPVAHSKTSGVITDAYFNDPLCTWEHNGEFQEEIYYTIVFRGTVVDGMIKVPNEITQPITKTHEVNGRTYWIRTTTTTISIRSSGYAECNAYDSCFAFSTPQPRVI